MRSPKRPESALTGSVSRQGAHAAATSGRTVATLARGLEHLSDASEEVGEVGQEADDREQAHDEVAVGLEAAPDLAERREGIEHVDEARLADHRQATVREHVEER